MRLTLQFGGYRSDWKPLYAAPGHGYQIVAFSGSDFALPDGQELDVRVEIEPPEGEARG